ncbi:MAG: T9SS type A sorting domain-containing protein [Bacteroidales bacterium]
MKCKKLVILLSLMLIFSSAEVVAQQTMSSAFDNLSSTSGSVSYTVGQMLFTDLNNLDFQIYQAINIPIETFQKNNTGIVKKETSFYAFPNPCTDFVILKFNSIESTDLIYQLFDINGNLKKQGAITWNETQIELIDLPPSLYLVRILENQKEIENIKFIKN